MKAILLVLLIFLTITIACEKNETETSLNIDGQISRIENEQHEVISKFIYNNDGTLKTSWHKNEVFMGDKKEEYTYTYDSNGFLINKKGFEPGNMIMSSLTGAMDKEVSISFEYNENKKISKIVRSYDYNEFEDINYTTTTILEYPNDSIIVEQTLHNQANDVPYYKEYTYNNLGNIYKIAEYAIEVVGEKKIFSEETISYDNKKAPISNEPIFVSKNNIINRSLNVYDIDFQSLSYNSTTKFEYTYNENDYPEIETEIWPNEIIRICYYFY